MTKDTLRTADVERTKKIHDLNDRGYVFYRERDLWELPGQEDHYYHEHVGEGIHLHNDSTHDDHESKVKDNDDN